MAVGPSRPCCEENAGGNALETPPQSPRVGHVARPLNSPHLRPHKRPLQTEQCTFDLAAEQTCQQMPEDIVLECSMAKRCKPDQSPCHSDSDTTAPSESPTAEEFSIPTPAVEVAEVKSDQAQAAQGPPSSSNSPGPCQTLEEASKVVMDLYMEVYTAFVLLKDLKNEAKAEKMAAQWAAEHYEELKSATLNLLPWLGEMTPSTDGSYDVISFQRSGTVLMNSNMRGPEKIAAYKEDLKSFRLKGERYRAWEALCAVLSVISTREEKGWVENFDVQDDLDDLKKVPLCKSKGSARRRAKILDTIIPMVKEEGAGAFCEYLIDPTSMQRVTFTRGPAGPVPATSMTVRRMPLWDAFKTMDDDGPLRGAATKQSWVRAAGRQFALQDLAFGYDSESRQARVCAQGLELDPQIRDLLRSKKPVILLDTLAALGPRDVCKTHRISDIVQGELATLFREAKARGEAVVFCLGGNDPHKLAERVYLRPPLADHGLRIGFLRWRESADSPWAREYGWDDRTAIGLQLP